MTKYPKGTIKAFRKYLNKQFPVATSPYKNNHYGNKKRNYGDYLYTQDRDMFDMNLNRAVRGDEDFKDFDNQYKPTCST